MSQLFAASLAPVRRPDLHTVLQPSVRDLVIVDVDLKGDRVFLLSVEVLQGRGDDDGWKTTRPRFKVPGSISDIFFFLSTSPSLMSIFFHGFADDVQVSSALKCS